MLFITVEGGEHYEEYTTIVTYKTNKDTINRDKEIFFNGCN